MKKLPAETPVYLFLGFLESGKTKFIQETFEDLRFSSGEKTLLLVCEEGVEEYETIKFSNAESVDLVVIEGKSQLTEEYLANLQIEHGAERIVVEYNGMWELEDFFNAMPEGWMVNQIMTFFDSNTFVTYNANMRSLVFDKIVNSEMVVFNRASDKVNKEEFHRIVRETGNRRCQIVYEYPDGQMEYDEIEDPLPFDKDADVIEIDDGDYALFYQDLSDDLMSYDRKKVKFKGIVARDKSLGVGSFIAGRHVMTCCADDIQYSGLICRYETKNGADVPIRSRDWVVVEGEIRIERHPLYRDKGPVLYVTSYAATSKPNPEVATF